jgi:hypothetical protein
MSEHILPSKTVALVAGVTSLLTWSGAEFQQAFPESIIKQPVAMRLSCSTTTVNSVNIGVRYETASKSYRVAERQTIATIPAGGSVEITPSSVAPLGLLYEYITSITVELTCLSAGSATVVLILDDDPPPLSNLPGEPIGLDARSNLDYNLIQLSGVRTVAPGVDPFTIYTVPGGVRFYLDMLAFNLDITPSYPSVFSGQVQITRNFVTSSLPAAYSGCEHVVQYALPTFTQPLGTGDSIRIQWVNAAGAALNSEYAMYGREVF